MNISFTKHTLDNGLDVLLHEDHACPIVAVNLWYHVGSKNERPGKTGFAHLFEHLMFEGSQHHDRGYFQPLQGAGATLNGSTNADRTNYWEVVPSGALELALWMESDRMGYLLPALTEAKFANQRDVVLNERRQNYENRPYGLAPMALLAALFPPDHPYHWTTIGEIADLQAVQLDEVHAFFRRYYHPGERLARARRRHRHRDDALATGRRGISARSRRRAGRSRSARRQRCRATSRIYFEDRVELPRLYIAWLTPAMFADGDADLDLATDLLANGKTSRLYRRLVFEERIATDVSAAQNSREIAGFAQMTATAAPGHTLAELEHVDPRRDRAPRRGRPDRRRDRARTRAGRSAVHVPAADGRRLRRQVRSAERLQRLPRRPGLLRSRSGALSGGDAVVAAAGRGALSRSGAPRDAQHRAARPRRAGGARFDAGGGRRDAR